MILIFWVYEHLQSKLEFCKPETLYSNSNSNWRNLLEALYFLLIPTISHTGDLSYGLKVIPSQKLAQF